MGDEAPARLFYGILTVDAFRKFAAASRGHGVVDDLDPDVFGAAPPTVAYSFEARRYVDRKLSAMAAHRSAFGLTLEMQRNPSPPIKGLLWAFPPAFVREDFLLAGMRGAVPRWPVPDPFDAIPAAGLADRTFCQDPAGVLR